MKSLAFRPATIDDLEPVHRIVTCQNIRDYGESFCTMKSLYDQWTSPDHDLASNTVLAVTSNREIAGFAELMEKENIAVYLADPFQQVEYACSLLGQVEICAKAQYQPGETLTLYGRAVNSNRILRQAFEESGYISKLSFLIMEIRLVDAPQAPRWPEGVTVRAFVNGQDEQAVYRVDEDASADKGYHVALSFEGWSKRMGMNTDLFDPGLWFLVFEQDELAGVCLNFLSRDTNTAWVDHLSVRRTSRKRGIGKALLLHSIGEFHKRGVRTIKLSVDSASLTNAPRLYESAGMRTIQHYHIYKKQIQ